MIEFEILNACLSIPNNNKYSNGYDSYCILKDSSNKEIDRTDICYQSFDPAWSRKITKPYHDLNSKEKLNNRPFYLESFIVEIYDISQTKEKSDKIKHIKMYETRVPLSNVGLFKSYRLLKTHNSSTSIEDSSVALDESRIFIRINRIDDIVANDFSSIDSFAYAELSALYPTTHPMYRHLYIDFSWSSQAYTYTGGLPGPTKGELVIDIYYQVEWKVATGNNLFGDRFYVNSIGNLIITDLRIIFLPLEVSSPFWTELLTNTNPTSDHTNANSSYYGGTTASSPHSSCHNFFGQAGGITNRHGNYTTPDQILIAQRYTFQMPLSAIAECKSFLSTNSSHCSNSSSSLIDYQVASQPPWVLYIESMDGSTAEFLIRKYKPSSPVARRRNLTKPDLGRKLSDEISTAKKRNFFQPFVMQDINKQFQNMLENATNQSLRSYRLGLDTMEVDPQQWCERVLDYIHWEIKLDMIWIRWAKYIKLTCLQLHHHSEHDQFWLKIARKGIDLFDDYQRLRVHDCDWQLSDLNISYSLCSTYPSLLVLPKNLSNDEIKKAASERSISRVPSMVWLHPYLKAPLCRASQPMAGMKGSSIEYDKKMLLAIKASCLTGLPMRIADARPKLNANANAVQGKGFENITFLGGPLVASISFLDIDNIHVMRSSIQKLRDSGASGSSSSSSGHDGSGVATASSGGTGTGSGGSNGWLNHIMSVLKGAVSVADSLMLGHPVLVHCSDGWDRTSQLTSLAQIMLDPYYRTIEGFMVLVYKEWILHGHKFEDRLGKLGKKQEVSPVFLQFLDAVYQILRQFPIHFEFSSQFVTLFSQLAYSGYFLSFRKNSERERLQLIRGIGAYEDMATEDFDFSAFSCYVRILLKSSNYCNVLFNPLYIPPNATKKLVNYLRPRYNKHDLDLWRDGLCGLNNNLLLITALSPPSITHNEASIMHHDLYQRTMGYVDLHHEHLPPSMLTKLIDIKATEYPQFFCPNSSIWQYYNPNKSNSNNNSSNSSNYKTTHSKTVSSKMTYNYLESHVFNAIFPNNNNATTISTSSSSLVSSIHSDASFSNICSGLSCYTIDTVLASLLPAAATSTNYNTSLSSSDPTIALGSIPLVGDIHNQFYHMSYYPALELQRCQLCCIRIQLWYRSILFASTAAATIVLDSCHQYIPNESHLQAAATITHTSKLQSPNNTMHKILLTIIISYLKSKQRVKERIHQVNQRFILSILDEIIEDTLIQSFRNEMIMHSKHNEWNLVNSSSSSLVDLDNMLQSNHYNTLGTSRISGDAGMTGDNNYRRSYSGNGAREASSSSPIPTDNLRSSSSKNNSPINHIPSKATSSSSGSNNNSNNNSASKSFSRFFGGFSSSNSSSASNNTTSHLNNNKDTT